jgi:hypothetical protein
MSDKTQPTPPPAPAQKTAAVPLKKETVRITLRARPGAGLTQPKEMTAPVPPPSITSPVPRPITTSVTPAGAANTGRVPTAPAPMSPVPLARPGTAPVSKATAPIQLPSAPLPPPAARPATAPVQLPPGAPAAARTTTYVKLDSVPPPAGPSGPPRPLAPGAAPTVPLAKAPGPPRPPGAPPGPPRPGGGMAPTVPLAKAPGAPPGPPRAPGAKVEAGASTVPLSKAPSVVPKPPGSGTAPMAKTGGPTQSLPKATVQLAKGPGTQALARPPVPAAAPARSDSGPVEEERDPEAGLAPLAIVCALLAIGLGVLTFFGADRGEGFTANPGETHPLMLQAAPAAGWEKDDGNGNYTSTFQVDLKEASKNFD